MRRQVVIVAGGSGKRMGTDVPKQFLPLGGRPILMRTIERFVQFDARMEIFVVLPESQIDYWRELCRKVNFSRFHRIISGGSERFFSVKNGLKLVDSEAVVAIHDAVRPFVSDATLQRCFDTAERLGNAIPTIAVSDSLREVDGVESHAVERKNYRIVQTPQVFRAEQLLRAFEQDFSPSFTDDASVVEAFGERIHLVDGNVENIKLTTPFDMVVGEEILKNIVK